MRLTRTLVLGACLALGFLRPVWADDPLQWLNRMDQAGRSLNFSGVFVYQNQGVTQSSRIYHMVDAAGEHERLETLNPPMREVVRNNEDVQFFLPQERILILERMVRGRQPGQLLVKPAQLAEFYTISFGESSRVAGRVARQIIFEPRDEMRYGYRYWVDQATGLLLRAQLQGSAPGSQVEQFMFTEVATGVAADPARLKPRSVNTREWRVVNARGDELPLSVIDWNFGKLPPGFRNVSLVRRKVSANETGAIHAVFSDGLASVSVFIEDHAKASGPAQSSAGTTGLVQRNLGDQLITVVGELPLPALRRIADGIQRRAH